MLLLRRLGVDLPRVERNDMAEPLEPTLAETLAQLTENRALLERIRQNRLEDSDWSTIKSLVAELIEQVEATGQESVTIDLPQSDGDESDHDVCTRVRPEGSAASEKSNR